MTNLAKALRRHASSLGLNDSDLARSLGCDKSLLSRILSGKQTVSTGTISRLVVTLTAPEAVKVLEGYFLDELQEIRQKRIERANEGSKVVDRQFAILVNVAAG